MYSQTTSKCGENNRLAYMGQQSMLMFFITFLMSTAINSNCTNTWQNVISLCPICDHMAPRVIHALHPNISIHILHTLLYLFLLVLTRRIYLKIKASYVGDHFLYSHDLNEWFSQITVRSKLYRSNKGNFGKTLKIQVKLTLNCLRALAINFLIV